MQSGFDFTTLVFLGLAIFVAWKLRSVLGTKTGNEQPPVDPFKRKDSSEESPTAPRDNVIRLPNAANDGTAKDFARNVDRWAGVVASGSALAQGLDAVAALEPNFDARGFVEGAKSAYEMIVTDFAKGDRKSLKGLLSKEVFEGFDQAITERETNKETAETTFVSIDKAELISAEVKGKTAQLTLSFASKLITSVRDAKGVVVDGNSDGVTDVTDVWTFARQLGARDPNWLLVATEAGH